MNKIAIHVGNKIRQIRKQKRITLISLSYMCDIEYSYLSKIEQGKINTSIGHLVKIATSLDICFVCFFTNDEADAQQLINAPVIEMVLFSEIHKLKQI